MWKNVIVGMLIFLCISNSGIVAANDLDGTNDAPKSVEIKVQSTKLRIDEEAVRKRMQQDNYTDSQMTTRVGLLSGLDARLQDSLDGYLKDGTISESFSVNGLTLKNIMKITGDDFFEAMCEMDRCIKKPRLVEHAKYAMKKHDKIRYDKLLVHRIMKNEFHYDEQSLEWDVSVISQYDEILQPVLDQYLKDRTITDEFAIDGLTIGQIMKKERCNFFSALHIMNRCVENPFLAICYTEYGSLVFEE